MSLPVCPVYQASQLGGLQLTTSTTSRQPAHLDLILHHSVLGRTAVRQNLPSRTDWSDYRRPDIWTAHREHHASGLAGDLCQPRLHWLDPHHLRRYVVGRYFVAMA